MPSKTALAACSSGRRAGWAVRRFELPVLNEVPGVVLCSRAQGEGPFLYIKSSQVLTPQSCKGQDACANKEGGMPAKDFARSLPLRTSRRLGSAPVWLVCTQRGPKRGLVPNVVLCLCEAKGARRVSGTQRSLIDIMLPY
jgi:hypothetical protein